jgi:hypothetical protein
MTKTDAQNDFVSTAGAASSTGCPEDAVVERKWRPITAADEGARMLVTNNLHARDAHGGMSHVWISHIIEASDPDRTGPYVGYDEGDRLIENLTHCAAIPMACPICSDRGFVPGDPEGAPIEDCPRCVRSPRAALAKASA